MARTVHLLGARQDKRAPPQLMSCSFRRGGFEVEPWPVYDPTASGSPLIDVALHEWLGLFAYWAFGRTSALSCPAINHVGACGRIQLDLSRNRCRRSGTPTTSLFAVTSVLRTVSDSSMCARELTYCFLKLGN